MANNLLSINDLSKKEILELIEFANNFFNDEGSFRRESLFPDKTIANVFCEPSTRTKSSFAIAAKNLGCSVIDFNLYFKACKFFIYSFSIYISYINARSCKN